LHPWRHRHRSDLRHLSRHSIPLDQQHQQIRWDPQHHWFQTHQSNPSDQRHLQNLYCPSGRQRPQRQLGLRHPHYPLRRQHQWDHPRQRHLSDQRRPLHPPIR
jgi:hypothetical protein